MKKETKLIINELINFVNDDNRIYESFLEYVDLSDEAYTVAIRDFRKAKVTR